MIANNLGQTEMGRDMLAQDYILKQLTASLIYPEKNLGKKFWDEVYTKSRLIYGTTQIPVDTFNKVWIVADKAEIFERGNVAYIVGAHLKVMLEEDYLALDKNIVGVGSKPAQERVGHGPALTDVNQLGSQIIRRIILPQIEKEVNCGKNFAPLRQMFYSMILASWYKMALKDALLTQIYGNQSKVKVGINQPDPKANEEIFQRYLTAYKKGVFNYIKVDMDQSNRQSVPRKYFSGGEDLAMLPRTVHRGFVLPEGFSFPDRAVLVTVNTTPVDSAMARSDIIDLLRELPGKNFQQRLAILREKIKSRDDLNSTEKVIIDALNFKENLWLRHTLRQIEEIKKIMELSLSLDSILDLLFDGIKGYDPYFLKRNISAILSDPYLIVNLSEKSNSTARMILNLKILEKEISFVLNPFQYRLKPSIKTNFEGVRSIAQTALVILAKELLSSQELEVLPAMKDTNWRRDKRYRYLESRTHLVISKFPEHDPEILIGELSSDILRSGRQFYIVATRAQASQAMTAEKIVEEKHEINPTVPGKKEQKIVFYVNYPSNHSGPLPVAFVFHGWQASKEDPFLQELAHAVAKEGYLVVRPDFRKHRGNIWDPAHKGFKENGNESSGHVKEFVWGESLEDVRYILDFLKRNTERTLPQSNLDAGVLLLGHSYGGWTARAIAAKANEPGQTPFEGLKVNGVFDIAGTLDLRRALTNIIMQNLPDFWRFSPFLDQLIAQKLDAWQEGKGAPMQAWDGFQFWQEERFKPYMLGAFDVPYFNLIGSKDRLIFTHNSYEEIKRKSISRFENLGAVAKIYIVNGMGHFIVDPFKASVIEQILYEIRHLKNAPDGSFAFQMLDPSTGALSAVNLGHLFTNNVPLPAAWDVFKMGLAVRLSNKERPVNIPVFFNTVPADGQDMRMVKIVCTDDGKIELEDQRGQSYKNLIEMKLISIKLRLIQFAVQDSAFNQKALQSVLISAMEPIVLAKGWHIQSDQKSAHFWENGVPRIVYLKSRIGDEIHDVELWSTEQSKDQETRFDIYVERKYRGNIVFHLQNGYIKSYHFNLSPERNNPWLGNFLKSWTIDQKGKPFDWRNLTVAAPPDLAAVAQISNTRGGIDFNRSHMHIHVRKEGQGVRMQFDAAMVQRIKREGFDGLGFEIQRIIPVANFPLLLGLKASEEGLLKL